MIRRQFTTTKLAVAFVACLASVGCGRAARDSARVYSFASPFKPKVTGRDAIRALAETPVSIEVNQASLSGVMTELSLQSGVHVHTRGILREIDRYRTKVTLKLTDVPLFKAVHKVCQAADFSDAFGSGPLEWIVEDEGIVVDVERFSDGTEVSLFDTADILKAHSKRELDQLLRTLEWRLDLTGKNEGVYAMRMGDALGLGDEFRVEEDKLVVVARPELLRVFPPFLASVRSFYGRAKKNKSLHVDVRRLAKEEGAGTPDPRFKVSIRARSRSVQFNPYLKQWICLAHFGSDSTGPVKRIWLYERSVWIERGLQLHLHDSIASEIDLTALQPSAVPEQPEFKPLPPGRYKLCVLYEDVLHTDRNAWTGMVISDALAFEKLR